MTTTRKKREFYGNTRKARTPTHKQALAAARLLEDYVKGERRAAMAACRASRSDSDLVELLIVWAEDAALLAIRGIRKALDSQEHLRSLRMIGNALRADASLSSKGGQARAAALSPERRREIAIRAAETRWRKDPDVPRGG